MNDDDLFQVCEGCRKLEYFWLDAGQTAKIRCVVAEVKLMTCAYLHFLVSPAFQAVPSL